MAKYTCTFTTGEVSEYHELETDDVNTMLNGIMIINKSPVDIDENQQEGVALSH